ncbi:MAG: DUF2062 domain-containing protein [Chromatiales bacterium]|nr:DUF2062 domain-containing protein [Chromatiales bacterium]
MAKKLFKRWLPDHNTIKTHPHLKRFGTRLHDPNLWHINRHTVPGAVSIGLLVAITFPLFQMASAAALAIYLRVNLPISVALTWVTNPFTTPAVLYFCYRLGAWLLGQPVYHISFSEISFDWLWNQLEAIGAPLVLGSVVCGVVAAILGNLFVRSFWRFHVISSWRKRNRLRRRNDNQC